VQRALARKPDLLDAYSAEGFPAIGLAAHFGHVEVMRWLIDQGADVDRVASHRLAVTPLHAALFGHQVEAARLLIDRGADVTPARADQAGSAGWTALHYAAGMGFSARAAAPRAGADPAKG
jgi:ankyrin repeat protein